MPPVLGPVSPSPTLLWSCALARGIAVIPSHKAKKLASMPSRYSSIKTVFPASPKAPLNELSIAVIASFSFWAMTTPLPAAKPSAFITIGNLFFLI